MKKCPKCKNEISDKLDICTECGHKLSLLHSELNEHKSKTVKEVKIEKPKEVAKAEIPTFHYLFLVASIFFNFGFWFIPVIGVLLSYGALSELGEQTSKNIEVGNHVLYTIITGGIHFIYILVVIF